MPSLKTVCPKCKTGKIFDGILLKRHQHCTECGLDYTQFAKGDGPVFIVMSVLCLVIGIAAVWLELAISPPLWLHITCWPIIGSALSIVLLRPAHAYFMDWHYQVRMGEDEA